MDKTISSYRRRQKQGPFIVWGLAAILIVAGIIFLIVWLTGPSKPSMSFNLFATDTPTPTLTLTPTLTNTPTETPTITPTSTETPTPTPSSPFDIVVQEGDSLAVLAERYNLGDDGILLILAINPTIAARGGTLYVGETITIPNPGMPLPTATPIPSDLPKGTLVEYTVLPGDSLYVIAAKFNSTVEDIVAENELENQNDIFVGDVLLIPVNMVTPVPTSTPGAETATPTATP